MSMLHVYAPWTSEITGKTHILMVYINLKKENL